MRLDFDDDNDNSEEKSIKAAKKSKRVKVEKDIDDSVPLPSPFLCLSTIHTMWKMP